MPAFDEHRPPAQSIIDDCVHCGFCLDACPTYALWGQEADSPRGRIVLIDEALNRSETLSDEIVTHLDRCLGCMACVPACPSGVRYDRLLERVRPQVERNHERSTAESALRLLLFETLPHPRRLRALVPALEAARKLGGERMPGRLAMLAKVAPRTPSRSERRRADPRGDPGARRAARPRRAAARMRSAGVLPPGSPGDDRGPRRRGLRGPGARAPRLLRRARAPCRRGGGRQRPRPGDDRRLRRARRARSRGRQLRRLRRGDEGVRRVSRHPDRAGVLGPGPRRHRGARRRAPRARARGPVPMRVAYHDACHLAHAQGVRAEPRALLRGIPGARAARGPAPSPRSAAARPGSTTSFSPRPARRWERARLRPCSTPGPRRSPPATRAVPPRSSATCDEAGHPLPVVHPVELLWRSLQAAR